MWPILPDRKDCVGVELREGKSGAQAVDDVVEGARSQRFTRIAERLAEEERSGRSTTEPVEQVGPHGLDVVAEEAFGRGRHRDVSGPPALGVLGPNVDETRRPIDVIEPQAEQLLAAQGGVVGEEDERLVAQRFVAEEVGQQGAPFVIGRDPRQASPAGQQTPRRIGTASLAPQHRADRIPS